MNRNARVAVLEPWFGESHATLFSGIAEHSNLDCQLVTLKSRRWRWRMRLGAFHIARRLLALTSRPDAIIASDYVNLPVLVGLCPRIAPLPKAVYFLENQLSYPAQRDGRGDFEFAAINFLTCVAADRCVFCSENHLNAFLKKLPKFLSHDRDIDIKDVISEISKKSLVIPIGVDLERFDRARQSRPNRTGLPLRLVWPHRFEHDKNPDDFFDVLCTLAEEGLPFEVAVVGRSYRDIPRSMLRARDLLGDKIVLWGFLEGDSYAQALAGSDVVVSTAWHETQGLAVIEAIRSGCDPLLPKRLCYPEILGPELSEKHLYTAKGDLRRRLRWMMRHPDRIRRKSTHWPEMERFGWKSVAPKFDELVWEMIASAGRC